MIIEINEARINATSGAEWWMWFRHGLERTGRLNIMAASIGGDRVSFEWGNAAAFIDVATSNGVPLPAIKVTT